MTIAGYGIRSSTGGSWLHTIEPAVWMQSQDDALSFETEVAACNAAEAHGLTYYRVEPIAAISEERGLIRKQGTITWRDGLRDLHKQGFLRHPITDISLALDAEVEE